MFPFVTVRVGRIALRGLHLYLCNRRKKIRILTLENELYELNNLPEEVDEDLRFCVLDNSDPKEPDFFWIPLIFLESFNAPALVLNIGGNVIKMPIEETKPWFVLIGDKEVGELEVVPITSLNDRGFKVFAFNPMGDYRHDFMDIDIVNVFTGIKWYFPKLKPGQLLAVPLNDEPNPPCVYFGKEISRQSEIVNRGLIA